MKVAVTGPRGRLASWLIAHYGAIPLECDITKFDATRIEIQRVEPDVIINAAAYTNVDKAETEREEALLINLRGTGNVRMAFSGYLVHLSTAYIFDGNSAKPYREDAEPSPVCHYGWTKWGSEAAMLTGGEEAGLIVRTMSLYGRRRDDFVSACLQVLADRGTISLPSQHISNPTYIPHLAEAIMAAIDKQVTGVLNLAGTTVVSRADWAREIAKAFRLKANVGDVTFTIGPADRPRNASLDLARAESLGLPLYSLKQGLKDLKRCLG